MITSVAKQFLSLTLCFLLVMVTWPFGAGAQQPAQQPAQPSAQPAAAGYSGQGAPLTAEEIQGLVAPIALYPDSLVAQVLGAATFPDQCAEADTWLHDNSALTGSALTNAVNTQTWDPSVKALTQFPSVLDNMANNLSWTSQLGQAFHG